MSNTFALIEEQRIKRRCKGNKDHVEPKSQATINVVTYIIFLFLWIPYTIAVYVSSEMTPKILYHLAIIGMSRCLLGGCLYWANEEFRFGFRSVCIFVFKKERLINFSKLTNDECFCRRARLQRHKASVKDIALEGIQSSSHL